MDHLYSFATKLLQILDFKKIVKFSLSLLLVLIRTHGAFDQVLDYVFAIRYLALDLLHHSLYLGALLVNLPELDAIIDERTHRGEYTGRHSRVL